jgi:hypothetical protein
VDIANVPSPALEEKGQMTLKPLRWASVALNDQELTWL